MPSIASSKVTMTTILSQRKAGPWKRDFEKTKDRFQPSAGPGNKISLASLSCDQRLPWETELNLACFFFP